jgi:hypothetical protein
LWLINGRIQGRRVNSKKRTAFRLPKYISMSLDEAVRLIICVLFDVAEYVVPVLLAPFLGDVLDIVGIGVGILLFRWVGLMSILEFLPFVDIFPIFILTWITWFYLKKKEEARKIREEWK